ncbi:kelch domain-containing 4 [Brachionus plicatilis]|uniref:Kelch domain-containing 4 n=1 Tax=Brachionus plicatilis TaxID=10195 RepID=A0A3M7T745_BRAPC|nr:kelch domain-containing 4 [Brachionus plicatilis]
MGKNKEKKKKGLGMEKTMAKTEKKAQKNIKKELKEIGEEDIETIIENFAKKEAELNQVKEIQLPEGQFPSRRGGASFNLSPEREELILFGGDYFDGVKVFMYNDLFIYSIKKNQWSQIKAPNAPPPRTFHQSVYVSRNSGELWVFGGEFSSPSQSQFYHYNDLWMFSFQTKAWTKIISPNTPSPRSGHRMAVLKKHLVLFGGYYDNLRNCKFYNDTFLFNLETNQWEEMKFTASNDPPSPRSACQLNVCAKNNTVVIYGGFSKEKLKKDREKGIVHSDMYVLACDTKKNDKVEWCWKRAKQSGAKPSERISFSMIPLHDDTALLFGGVFDQDDADIDEDDESNSKFFNDLYKLDLSSYKWINLSLRGKKEIKSKKCQKAEVMEMEENELDESVEDEAPDVNMEDLSLQKDEVFTLTYENRPAKSDDVSEVVKEEKRIFMPHPRRSAYLQFFKGNLYLYGGKFEDPNDKEFTFNDMYCLNIKKLDEWKTLYEDKEINEELKKQMESSDIEEDSEEEESDDEELEIDAPVVEDDETLSDYFERTEDVWLSEAQKEFPDEKSKKNLKKMAIELCKMFWDNCK